jgi:hypothetical protein
VDAVSDDDDTDGVDPVEGDRRKLVAWGHEQPFFDLVENHHQLEG